MKDIQSLLGKLSFVGACVRSSRVFVSRILIRLRECNATSRSNFMVPVEVRKDLRWWRGFLPLFHGKFLIDYREWSHVDSVFSCGSFNWVWWYL